jgi:hypothetical protein
MPDGPRAGPILLENTLQVPDFPSTKFVTNKPADKLIVSRKETPWRLSVLRRGGDPKKEVFMKKNQ